MHLDPTLELFDEHTFDIPIEATDDSPQPSNEAVVNTACVAPPVTPIAPEENAAKASAETILPTPGAVLNDRFLLEAEIGVGGSAVVYRARDLHWNAASNSDASRNEWVAIKMPRPELADLSRGRLRLRNEHRTMRALSHPNIVRVFDVHANGVSCFMTMELIHGQLLSTLLQERPTLPLALTRNILRACAQALSHAHANHIVHGDFKPGNVFVMADESVRVFDFGAAVSPFNADTHKPAATLAYSSPEVLNGETPTVQDDVFSFACVAYQLLNSRHPFNKCSSLEARSKGLLPLRAWNLHSTQWLALLAALSWRRDQRPSSIEALIDAVLTEHDTAAEAQTPALRGVEPAVANAHIEPAPPPKHRMLRRWAVVCAALAFIAGVLAVGLIASQRQGAPTETGAESARLNDSTVSATWISQAALGASMPAEAERDRVEMPNADTNDRLAAAVATAAPARARSEVSFESGKITTSKQSVSVVFLIKRTPPLTGRVRVKWRVDHETTGAPVEFASVTSGTVEFADGQTLRALYVPLRNDALTEADRSFLVRLHSPQSAKLGSITTAQAQFLQ